MQKFSPGSSAPLEVLSIQFSPEVQFHHKFCLSRVLSLQKFIRSTHRNIVMGCPVDPKSGDSCPSRTSGVSKTCTERLHLKLGFLQLFSFWTHCLAMVSILACHTGGAEFLLCKVSEFWSMIIARPRLDIYSTMYSTNTVTVPPPIHSSTQPVFKEN